MYLEEPLPQRTIVKAKKSPIKASLTSVHRAELEENALIITAEEKLLIEEQMRKHVQLTTQLFFLCKGSEDFEPLTSTCRQLLRELDIFRCVSMARDLSSYNVCNLQLAIDVVGEDNSWNLSQENEDASSYSVEDTNSNTTDSDYDSVDGGKKIARKKGSTSTKHPLLPSQVEVFWSSPVFLYPQLLPCRRLLTQEEARDSRLTFTTGEDNLIALGLEQFQHLKNPRSLLQKYLLPAKTIKQINLRIKNMSSQRSPDNPIKYFRQNKNMMAKMLVVEAFSPDQMVALQDQDDSVLPIWAKKKRAKETALAVKEKKKQEKKSSERKRSSSLSTPLDLADINNQLEVDVTWSPSKKHRSAPVSPADNEDGDSGAKRRCVEDTYPHLTYNFPPKTPVGKPIITPEGIFIPFKVVPQGTSVSTPSTPSSTFPNPQLSLPTSISTDFNSLRGSIRVIPGTKPGESPQILSSLIAIPGKPVQLFCGPDTGTSAVEGSEGQDRGHYQEQTSDLKKTSVSNQGRAVDVTESVEVVSGDVCEQTEVYESGSPSLTSAARESVLVDEEMSFECNTDAVDTVKTQSVEGADHCQVETSSRACGVSKGHTADGTRKMASEMSHLNLLNINKDRSQTCPTVMEFDDTDNPLVKCPTGTESDMTNNPHVTSAAAMESGVAENCGVTCPTVVEMDVDDNAQVTLRNLPEDPGLSSGHDNTVVSDNNQNNGVVQPSLSGTAVDEAEHGAQQLQSDNATDHTQDVSDSFDALAEGTLVEASLSNDISHQASQAVATSMKESQRESVVNLSLEVAASAVISEKQNEADVNTSIASAVILDSTQPQLSEGDICEVRVADVKEVSGADVKEVTVSDVNEVTVADVKEVSVADVNEVSVADVNEVSVADVKEVTVADVKEVSVADVNEVGVADVNEVSVADVEEVIGADVNEVSVADVNEVSVADVEEVIGADVNEVSVADVNEVSVADVEEVIGADVNEVSVADVEEVSGVDVKEVSGADVKEVSVADVKEVSGADVKEVSGADVKEVSGVDVKEVSVADVKEVSVADVEEVSGADVKEVSVADVEEVSGADVKEVSVADVKEVSVADVKEVSVGQVQEVGVADAPAHSGEDRAPVVLSAVSIHGVVPDQVFEITSGSEKMDQSISSSDQTSVGYKDSKEPVTTSSEELETSSEQKQEVVMGMSGDASNHGNTPKASGPAADELSPEGPPSFSSTPNVTPLEIIAAFCPYYSPASTSKTAQQSRLERTPPKRQSEIGFRELKPKPLCKLNEPEGDLPMPVSPFLPKIVSKSPKNKRVVVGNRTILPKAFVLDTKESPTKRAARSLRKRAQMICQRTSPCKLLPQTDLQRIQRLQLCPLSKSLSNIGRSKRKQATPVRKLLHNSLKRSNSESDDLSETDEGRRSEDSPRLRIGPKRKMSDVDGKQEESDGGQSEMEDAVLSQEDSQNEDEAEDGQTADKNHLDMLMTASTTLRFDHKKNRERSKSKKKKEQTLAMLAPDLLEMDPRKDEKDTAFAQAYLDRVRDGLSGNLQVYEEFLTLMYNVGKDGLSAIEVYKRLSQLLKDFPELLGDFAGFLLPEQALMCGCFMQNQEVTKARTLLRKLEVNYEQQPHHFQRVLKTLSQWYQNPKRSPDDLRDLIKPLIRGMPHLQEEFSVFFPEDKPPDSYMDSFEMVTLGDSDLDEDASVDSFEDVVMPSEVDPYRTNCCPCDCHDDPNDIKLHKRIRHCFNCCLKVIDGKLYFQPSSKKLHPAEVVVHKAMPPSPHTSTSLELEEDQTADKENHNCLSSRPTIVSPSVSHSSPARAKKIKLKICRQKAGQKRFLSLNEIGYSPVKQEPVKQEPVTSCDSDVAAEVAGSAHSDTGVMTRTRKFREKTSATRTSEYVVTVPDDLIVNPPVIMQDQILQDQNGDSPTPVTSCPVMFTSFSPVFTSSATVTAVCPSILTLVPPSVTTPSTQVPGSDRLIEIAPPNTIKPAGQTGGFVKLSPSKGPSSPNVTQISIGVTQTSGRSSGAVKSATTLTIGSSISALSGSSVPSVKESKIPREAASLPSFEAGRSKGAVSFPNLMPVGVSHADAITLNSGKQMPTPTASAANTSSCTATSAQVQASDGGSVSGTGFGMSILEMFDGQSMQGDASQSCMSDILAKAMKTAEISRSDAEISMSMDFMNNFLAGNFKTFGSRNNSPVKNMPVSSEVTQQSVISLKEHLVKAGIIHKPDDLQGGSSTHQNNNIGGQSGGFGNSVVTTVDGIPVTLIQSPSTERSGIRAQSFPLGMDRSEGELQTLGVSGASSLSYPVVNNPTVGESVLPPSQAAVSRETSAVVKSEYVWGAHEPQALTEGRDNDVPQLGPVGSAVSSTPQTGPVTDEPMEWEEEEETEVDWTKDMDKVCLEMCKKNGPGDETFAQVAEKLKVVTPNEVAARFEELMMLLSGLESQDDSENDD
ncbi:uncharacterized protein LOC124134138 isoform X2 [Haliotis rufescens]|nr:uncharacterized protein LOC124134138 isoform X2 [Haliotis rufescens]